MTEFTLVDIQNSDSPWRTAYRYQLRNNTLLSIRMRRGWIATERRVLVSWEGDEWIWDLREFREKINIEIEWYVIRADLETAMENWEQLDETAKWFTLRNTQETPTLKLYLDITAPGTALNTKLNDNVWEHIRTYIL